MNLLFSCSKIHCYLFPIFVYPITARLDKFIHQNLETPFYLYKGNYEHGTAKSSLLLADHSEDKTSSCQSSSTSGRDHVDARLHVGHIGNRSPSNVAMVLPKAALPFPMNYERFVSTTTDFRRFRRTTSNARTSTSSAGEGVRPR